VSTFIVLLGGTLAIAMFGRSAAESLATTMRAFLEQPDQFTMGGDDLTRLMQTILTRMMTILGPFFVLMVAAGLGGNLIQHRPVFTFDRIKPDFSKLSLGAGLKRMFGFDGLTIWARACSKSPSWCGRVDSGLAGAELARSVLGMRASRLVSFSPALIANLERNWNAQQRKP